jgi:hypothetical protein
MDQAAREVWDKAFDVLDRVDAWRAEREAERETESFDEKYRREGQEADQYLLERQRQRVVERAAPNGDLVFKTYEPKASPQMDWSQMNDWFERSFRNLAAPEREWVRKSVRDYVDEIVKLIGKETLDEDAKLLAKIKKLEADVGQLRADIEILRQYKANKPDDASIGSVTSLRGRHVA